MNARMRSAPSGAGTVAIVVLASADDLLLNDVVTIPVLTAVRHGHRGVARLVVVRRRLRIAILRWRRSVTAVVVRVAVAWCRLIVAARCVLARRPGHTDADNEYPSQKEPRHLYSSKPKTFPLFGHSVLLKM